MKLLSETGKSKTSLLLGIAVIIFLFFTLTACRSKDAFNGRGMNTPKIYWRGKSTVNFSQIVPLSMQFSDPKTEV